MSSTPFAEILFGLARRKIIKKKFEREEDVMCHLWAIKEITKTASALLKAKYNMAQSLQYDKEHKSVDKARKFKALGNKEFQEQKYAESILSYTKCALYAPADSPELSIAIANRSAALYHLSRFNDCIKDIELSIKFGYPENLHHKIQLRTVQCYLKLGKQNLVEDGLIKLNELINNSNHVSALVKENVEKQINEIILEKQQAPEITVSNVDKRTKPEVTYGENHQFRSASSAIEIRHNQEKGRYVVANRPIKMGDVLFAEKAFCSVPVHYTKLSDQCYHCFHPYSDIPVPCTMCMCCMYCDTQCLNEDWSLYHRWECPGNQMHLWQEVGVVHLAMKVLLTCTNTTDIIRFNQIQQLVTNFDKLETDTLLLHGSMALLITTYLSDFTDFFQVLDLEISLVKKFSDQMYSPNCEVVTNRGRQVYISSLVMRYILQSISNGHAIPETRGIFVEQVSADPFKREDNIIAAGLCPSVSMMNHSCDPNTQRLNMNQCLIVKAAKDIVTDEEIFNCYGPHYRHMPKCQRQDELKSTYQFTCKCIACSSSAYQYFMDRFAATKCGKCNGAVCRINDVSRCVDCNTAWNIQYQSEIKQAEEIYSSAVSLLDAGKACEALQLAKKCLNIRRTVLYKYNWDIFNTLELMADATMLAENFVDMLSYMDGAYTMIIERWGYVSVEAILMLRKITLACLKYLHVDGNMFTEQYRNILWKTREYLDRQEQLITFFSSCNKEREDLKEKKLEVALLVSKLSRLNS